MGANYRAARPDAPMDNTFVLMVTMAVPPEHA
jgi:hypothetical protein